MKIKSDVIIKASSLADMLITIIIYGKCSQIRRTSCLQKKA